MKKNNKTELSNIGEFSLIDQITRDFSNYNPQRFILGIGDDAAVIKNSENIFSLLAADTLVEENHFSRRISTDFEIGKKAVECNVSDMVAMGGAATWMTTSLVIPKNTDPEWIKNLYSGMQSVCKKYDITLLGGDTTSGGTMVISISMGGEVSKQNLCLRSHAQPGDLVAVTGKVGGSAAGYFLQKKGFEMSEYVKMRHIQPVCRADIIDSLAPLANAMIDISDGVASEARHIASASGTGIVIFPEKLPIHPEVFNAEKKLGLPKYYCALSGGEDFELLFSFPPQNKEKLITLLEDEMSIIGEIIPDKTQKILHFSSGEIIDLPAGWSHF